LTDEIGEAVRILKSDGLVVYPTETVYGLGSDALSDDAIMRVYEAKHRALSQPVSIAVSDGEMLAAVSRIPPGGEEFLERFLPGPVTVILKARNCLPELLTGGTGMIGVRIPAHPVPIEMIERLDAPITATSANQSGGREPVLPGDCHVPHDLLIDRGRLPGVPSTVVDLAQKKIIRPGILAADISEFLRIMP
jgi:L-threonylcarbamoyladenylate synthase